MKRAVSPEYVTVAPEGRVNVNTQGSGGSGAGPIIIFSAAAPSFTHGSGGVKPVNARVTSPLRGFVDKVPVSNAPVVVQGVGGKKTNNVPPRWFPNPTAWSTTKVSDGRPGSAAGRVRSAAMKTCTAPPGPSCGVGGVAYALPTTKSATRIRVTLTKNRFLISLSSFAKMHTPMPVNVRVIC